jgi:hypothetical protein
MSRVIYPLLFVAALFVGTGCATASGGRVVDRQGGPVRAVVRGYWHNPPLVYGERTMVESVYTDDQGRFTFEVPAKPDRIEAEAMDAKRYGFLDPVPALQSLVVVR